MAKRKKKRSETTSRRVARLASKVLRSKHSSRAARSLAGSALTQAPNRKKRKRRARPR